MGDAARDVDRGRLIQLEDVSLWTDVSGQGTRAIVLLSGADQPGFRWSPSFVDALVAAGYKVVRFDHRDCGRSSWLGSGQGYTLDDMVSDLGQLLEHLDLDSAHLIGWSMGAMIAQITAVEAPRVVRSLTLIGSTPGAGDERLPQPAEHLVEAMMRRLFAGPPLDRRGRISWMAERDGLLAGSAYPFDASDAQRLAAAEVATGWQPESGHGEAIHSSPSQIDRLAEISAAALVVHGTDDPVYPIEHGRELAATIPGSSLVEVENLGHEIPPGLLRDLLPSVIEHIQAADATL